MRRTINGRSVFIADDHHQVLPAWAAAARAHGGPLTLITLDHHADLIEAFQTYGAAQATRASDFLGASPDSAQLAAVIARNRLGEVDIQDSASIHAAAADLWHDEHIDCAIHLGLVSQAFVLLSWRHQALEHDRATTFNFAPCYPGCRKDIHDDQCRRQRAGLVIDDRWLGPTMERIAPHLPGAYILDIDLDVFNTRAAIAPRSAAIFHELIRHAALLTIARERQCVEDADLGCCLEEMDAGALEADLIRHIEAA